MKVFWELDAQQAQYILNLLATRPYQEVNDLIQVLLKQSNVAQPPEPPKPDLAEVPAEGNS